jgi:tetraacyldisaccharide 4'-kinase
VYQAGVSLRHFAYDRCFFVPKKVPAVVISIGNIVAGGVGKTPLVHFLAEEISKNHKIAILSRGYRSKAEHRKGSTLVEATMTAEEVGDEPLWLARKLPSIEIWVGKNRVASAKKAIANGAEILLLDDGFQHRSLHRDFDVVVLSGDAPLDNGYFLPRGYLRDCPSRLSKADILVVMGNALDKFPGAITFERRTSIEGFEGKKVALFCAIGNPHRFFQQIQQRGAQIVGSLCKPDHAFFSSEEIERLYHQSEAEVLVCTEKDFVKLLKTTVPILAVPLEIKISGGHELWTQFIKKIQTQVDYVRRIPSHAS